MLFTPQLFTLILTLSLEKKISQGWFLFSLFSFKSPVLCTIIFRGEDTRTSAHHLFLVHKVHTFFYHLMLMSGSFKARGVAARFGLAEI